MYISIYSDPCRAPECVLKHPTLHIETARAERKKKGRIASEGGGPGDEIDLRQLK